MAERKLPPFDDIWGKILDFKLHKFESHVHHEGMCPLAEISNIKKKLGINFSLIESCMIRVVFLEHSWNILHVILSPLFTGCYKNTIFHFLDNPMKYKKLWKLWKLNVVQVMRLTSYTICDFVKKKKKIIFIFHWWIPMKCHRVLLAWKNFGKLHLSVEINGKGSSSNKWGRGSHIFYDCASNSLQ